MPYANNQGIHIHYETEGEGPPLVLMHGLSGSLEDWHEFGYVEGLKRDYKLILVDGRGHGASDKPHDPEAYQMNLRAEDIVAVIEDLGIGQAHYLGYSTGATIGFAIAEYCPERFHSLILGGEHPYEYEEGRQMFQQLLSNGLEAFVAVLDEHYGPLSPATKARYLANDSQALLAMIPNEWPGFSDVLPGMTMPCLVYVGEDDSLAHSNLKRAVEEMSNVIFVSLPSVNHWQGYVRSDLILPHLRKFLVEIG